MKLLKPCYSKAIVIVHGKSEKQICEYIKSNLRLKMEVISDKKGEKSIQINSVMRILNDSRFKSFENFTNYFDDVEVIINKTKRSLSEYFKIFIIMDTDDCTEVQKQDFISGIMFKKHWANQYIVPIYNSPELESVLVDSNVKFEKKGDARKKEYIKIFPTDRKYSRQEVIELKSFCEQLETSKKTNMGNFINFCILDSIKDIAEEQIE